MNFSFQEKKLAGAGVILIIIVEIIISIIYGKYLYQYYKSKESYPLKQLLPTLSLLQGTFFYLYQLTISLLIILRLIDKENFQGLTQCQGKDQFKENEKIILILETIYLLSRGCCFTLTCVKSIRTIRIFSGKKINGSRLKFMFYKNEAILILIGLGFGCCYPILSFKTSYLNTKGFVCALSFYENSQGLLIYLNYSEEILTLLFIFMISYYHMKDKIISLTLKIQIQYVIWFVINSLVFSIGFQNGKNFLIIIFISCWIRCQWMFYCLIVKPYKKREQNPSLYITLKQIQSLDSIIEKKFDVFYKNNKILETFKAFLHHQGYIDNQRLQRKLDIQGMSELNLFKKFVKISQNLDSSNELDSNDQITKLFQFQNNYNPFKNSYELHSDLLQHFQVIYEEKFKKTKSYQELANICQCNEQVLENFRKLDITIQQWNYFDSPFQTQCIPEAQNTNVQ